MTNIANNISNLIHTIRGQQVMLDSDLANLYGYTVKAFNQQVKNNLERFPDDFMFQITKEEINKLYSSEIFVFNGNNINEKEEFMLEGKEDESIGSSRSKNLTLKNNGKRGQNTKYLPYAFNEMGVYMLSSVLKGELAISQSIQIMRAFKELKHLVTNNKILFSRDELIKLNYKVLHHEDEIQKINNTMATKDDILMIMDHFVSDTPLKEIIILNNQKYDAKEAYHKIISSAEETIIMIDDYVNFNTLSIFKYKQANVKVILITDNKGYGANKLTQKDVDDFNSQYGGLTIIKNGLCHDRYIVPDYNSANEKVYLSGASSKDAGSKVSTIILLSDSHLIHGIIDQLLSGEVLVLE